MLLSRAIARGLPSALVMAKSLIENPTIVSQTPPWSISLEVETHTKRGSAEVSQRPVIVPGTGVKQYLNDNVAPSPKEWHLSGYIPGDNLVEQTCLFTPIVRANVDFLWQAFDLGSRIIFKDQDQRIYRECVIAELETSPSKDCKNKMPFSMTIREIKTIESTLTELSEEQKNALPAKEDVGLGTTGTTSKPVGALYNVLGGDTAAAKFQ